MSLLKLSPEARRLRRVAKACAAGEISRFEYRETRRAVIDSFAANLGYGDDETMRRDDLDTTLRRREAIVAREEEERSPTGWLPWLIAAVLAVLVSGWAFASEIPAVRDRDPNPGTSERLAVAEVVWTVPEELSGIDAEDVARFLREELERVRRANAPLEHGFSAAELQQVGRFLNAIGVHDPGTQLSAQDLEDLAGLIAAQKERRGVAVTQLEDIAGELQVYVRARGYPLARAYVPKQTVVDGRVALDVLVGTLASVQVQGADASVSARFTSILGRPITDDELETKLNGLNRLPGVRAQASFVAGANVGESAMILDVADEQRLHGVVQLDNHGMEALGEERLVLLGEVNNPRGVGDQLAARFATSLSPSDQRQGGLSYLSPLFGGAFDGKIGLAVVDLDWQEALGVTGRGNLLDMELRDTRMFTRTRRRELKFVAGLHDLDWDGLLDQRAWHLGAGLSGHRLWDERKIALEGEVLGIYGGVDAARIGQDDRFWLTRLRGRGWTPWQVPWLDWSAKAVLGFEAQVSPDLLPTSHRLGLTGASANRGFAQAGLLVDEGVLLRGEILLEAPLGQWGVFLDAAYGDRNNPAEDWFQLSSVGLSWHAELYRQETRSLSSRLSIAKPVAHKGAPILDDDGALDEDAHIFWSLQYSQ